MHFRSVWRASAYLPDRMEECRTSEYLPKNTVSITIKMMIFVD